MAAVSETHLDTSGFYHTALDNIMDSLHITPTLEPARCNNSFKRHFNLADEDKFFSFCSTIKQSPKSNNVHKDSSNQQQNDATNTSIQHTPKRLVAMTKKKILFQATESSFEKLKPRTRIARNDKDLSPQSLLLKKAITRYECLQRKQERIALSKKPQRTSLRV